MKSWTILFTLILCLFQHNFVLVLTKATSEIIVQEPTLDIVLLFIIPFESDLKKVPAAIKTLNQNGIKATFFISQELTCVPKLLELIKQIQKHKNHEVGLFFILDGQKSPPSCGIVQSPIPNLIYRQTFAFNPPATAIYLKFINGADILDYDYLESKGRFILPKTENLIRYSTDGRMVLVRKGIHEIGEILKEAAKFEGIKWYTASEGYYYHPNKWPDWRRLHVKVQRS
jgi:hypothetical protein